MVLPWPPSACRPALHVGGNMPAGVISGIIGHCWCLAPSFQAMAAARLDAGRGRGCMVPWCCPGHPLPAGSEKGRCWSGERWRGGEKGGCAAGGKKVVAALETRAYSAQSCAANAALPRRPRRRLSRHPQRAIAVIIGIAIVAIAAVGAHRCMHPCELCPKRMVFSV